MRLEAERLPDGNILAPKSAEGPGVVGIGWVVLRPSDPDYAVWDRWLRSRRSYVGRLASRIKRRPTG